MTVKEVKDLLSSYRDIKEYQDYAREQIAELQREKATYMASFGGTMDGMPRAPGYSDAVSSKVIAAMQRYDSEIHSYRLGLEQNAQQLLQIRRLLRLVPARAGRILWQHYCLGRSWENLAGTCHYSTGGIRKVANRALAFLSQKTKVEKNRSGRYLLLRDGNGTDEKRSVPPINLVKYRQK